MRSIRIAVATAAALAAFSLPALSQSVVNLFLPRMGSGQSIAATTASASVTLSGESLNDQMLRIANLGTDTVYCRWGIGAQTATAADTAIPPAEVLIFSRSKATVVACIADSTTAAVRVMTGNNGI